MFNVRLACGHLYGKQLFTWLSLVVSLMASFVLSFFPLDVLDEIWDLIESVSEGFLTYSLYLFHTKALYTEIEVSEWDISILFLPVFKNGSSICDFHFVSKEKCDILYKERNYSTKKEFIHGHIRGKYV